MIRNKGLLHLITRAVEKAQEIKDIELAIGTDVIVDKLLMDIGNTVELGRSGTFRFLRGDDGKIEFITRTAYERYTYPESFYTIISDILDVYGYKEDKDFRTPGTESVLFIRKHYATRLEGEIEADALFHAKNMTIDIRAAKDNLPTGTALVYLDDDNELVCSDTKVGTYLDKFVKVSMKKIGNGFYFDLENTSEFVLACKYIKNGKPYLYVNKESIDNMRIGNIEKELGMRNNILGVLNPGEIGFSTVEEAEAALLNKKPSTKIVSVADTIKLKDEDDNRLTDTTKKIIDKRVYGSIRRQEDKAQRNTFCGLPGFGAIKMPMVKETFVESKPLTISADVVKKDDSKIPVSGMTGANWFNNLMLNKTKKD